MKCQSEDVLTKESDEKYERVTGAVKELPMVKVGTIRTTK